MSNNYEIKRSITQHTNYLQLFSLKLRFSVRPYVTNLRNTTAIFSGV